MRLFSLPRLAISAARRFCAGVRLAYLPALPTLSRHFLHT